ncbi:hypothetical protein DP83_06190 [Vibrio metoecus]|uniref:Uncharacterized protein n=1 Tax=Vibrio metoecus TaxID=1481663 RepID=A0ABR4S048_VIBMT|nr:hypothetical protein DP83_06190 [Vibrio metoecus]
MFLFLLLLIQCNPFFDTLGKSVSSALWFALVFGWLWRFSAPLVAFAQKVLAWNFSLSARIKKLEG